MSCTPGIELEQLWESYNKQKNCKETKESMLYPKTLKSINGLKTHKLIREQMMRQDFFDHLLKQLKLDLNTEQHDFLLNYLLAEKYQSKEEKTTANTQTNIMMTQKENCSHLNLIDTGLYQTTRKMPDKRNFTACSAIRPRQQNLKNKTIQNNNYQNDKDNNFYRSSIMRYESQGQYQTQNKFHKISLRTRKERNTCRSTKPPNRDSSTSKQTGLSREYLRKNYNQHFIKDIFERYTFQQKSFTMDEEFKDTHSFVNSEEIRQQQQRQESKYKNLTSIEFARSPRSRFRCKVKTRKF